MNYDIIVIGSGPAGLTAAIYARRAEKSVLVLEKGAFGGQITYSPKIENYPGYSSVSGTELADLMLSQALEQGAEVMPDEVVSVRVDGETKTVVCEGGEYTCRALIIATGARHRHLGVPGEEELIGDGISFCAVCDGAFYSGKDVAVIGGGNSALVEGGLLARQCASVTFLQNLDRFTGEAALVKSLSETENVAMHTGCLVTGFSKLADGRVGVRMERGGEASEMQFDGVFLAVGLQPDNGPFEGLLELERGYIVAGEDCRTNVSGIFAAGDCRTKSVRQITTAAADGAVAALAAVECC